MKPTVNGSSDRPHTRITDSHSGFKHNTAHLPSAIRSVSTCPPTIHTRTHTHRCFSDRHTHTGRQTVGVSVSSLSVSVFVALNFKLRPSPFFSFPANQSRRFSRIYIGVIITPVKNNVITSPPGSTARLRMKTIENQLKNDSLIENVDFGFIF